MPAYSFKERFVPMVEDGSKSQTIRKRRKYPPRVGQIAYLYFGLRTRYCGKLGEGLITKAISIRITEDIILFYERTLDDMELEIAKHTPHHESLPRTTVSVNTNMDLFAWRDGFRPEGSTMDVPLNAFEIMLRFWRSTHDLPFVGDLICWEKK